MDYTCGSIGALGTYHKRKKTISIYQWLEFPRGECGGRNRIVKRMADKN
jgi:hypothetical protein